MLLIFEDSSHIIILLVYGFRTLRRSEGFKWFVTNNMSVSIEEVSSLSTYTGKFVSSKRLISRNVSKCDFMMDLSKKSVLG